MDTPICDFIEKYAQADAIRLHMPGHKGKGVLFDWERYDLTEICGAPSLFEGDALTALSEQNLSAIFDTGASFYSCEGSSLCVRAMLYLAKITAQGKGSYILATRNAHRSLISASALVGFDIKWLYEANESYISATLTPEYLDSVLCEAEQKPFCVYVTSPDYLGAVMDIRAISEVCERHSTLLVVDNAHGAYLRFLPSNAHPIALGAHMCCDSAHKTLPALTGGAYLHISKNAPVALREQARDALALFASTSPSFLILASLDALNKYLSDGYSARLNDFILRVDALKARLVAHGYDIADSEPLKLVIKACSYGYTGTELASVLEREGVYLEMSDGELAVMMLTPENTDNELEMLENILKKIAPRQKISPPVFDFSLPDVKMSPRDALMSQKESVSVDMAIGRVCARICAFCPPAISIVCAGEVINADIAKMLKYYGIEKIDIVK